MEGVLVTLAVLACPLGMGLCMWLMSRGMRSGSEGKDTEPSKRPSLAELRSEQERLGAEIARTERAAGNGVEAPVSRDPARRA